MLYILLPSQGFRVHTTGNSESALALQLRGGCSLNGLVSALVSFDQAAGNTDMPDLFLSAETFSPALSGTLYFPVIILCSYYVTPSSITSHNIGVAQPSVLQYVSTCFC